MYLRRITFQQFGSTKHGSGSIALPCQGGEGVPGHFSMLPRRLETAEADMAGTEQVSSRPFQLMGKKEGVVTSGAAREQNSRACVCGKKENAPSRGPVRDPRCN